MAGPRIALIAVLGVLIASCTVSVADAHATSARITITAVNVGGPVGDSFAFQPSAHLSSTGFSLTGGQSWSMDVHASNAGAPKKQKLYTVTEPARPGYELTDVTCRRVVDGPDPIDADSITSLVNRRATILVSGHEHVACTFTNTRVREALTPSPTATIVMRAEIAPAAEAGRFDLLVDGAAILAGAGNGAQSDPAAVATGRHTVGERAAGAGSLDDYVKAIACTRPGPQGPVVVAATQGDQAALAIDVGDGDAVTCTVTNRRLMVAAPGFPEPPVVTRPEPPAVMPALQVAGTTAASPRRGSARLRMRGDCRSGRIVAAVTGRRIVKVIFAIDGRRAGTAMRADAQGRWTLALDRRRLRHGRHRVSARVQFARDSATRARSLRLSVSGCRHGRRPAF